MVMNLMNQSSSGDALPGDLEKAAGTLNISSSPDPSSPLSTVINLPPTLARWNTRIESLAGLEARGISRVLPEERYPPSRPGFVQLQMFILWFSSNITANNLAVGLLGPLVFNLGFVDSAMCAVFGAFAGSLGTAYTSIWGARSGNRTMIVARYFLGYWPAKITCFLNMILMVGYAVLSCIIAGQMLSAVSGGTMSIIVGIVIVALISWLVAVFGMKIFHHYERYQWIPQLIALLILVGKAAPHFDTSLQSLGTSGAITANRLSFFSLIFSVPISWAGAGSDFYVYYPETTSTKLTFAMTFLGLWFSFSFVNLVGVGLATGVNSIPSWSTAYDTSSGALILAGYGAFDAFHRFCGVVIALGVIANNIPGTYAAALGCQVLGRYGKAVPRYIWVCFIVTIYLVCAVAGRNNLFDIFENFLALMGYWMVIFITIMAEEHVIYRRNVGFDWTAWENKQKLPIGYAALSAFLIGWAGSIIGMSQAWYVGPVAERVGGIGADIGTWLGIAFTAVSFPPLRYLELMKAGR